MLIKNESKVLAIKISSLIVGYEKPILTNFSYKFKDGGFYAIIGRNGSGKTTLLRTIAGLLPKLSGSIEIFDKEISEYSAKDISKLLSIVFTDAIACSNISLRQLVSMGRIPYTNFWGKLTAEDEEIVKEAINRLGLESLSEREVSKLSDGQRQKAMIAKSLAQESPIIILDEPTAFLDAPSRRELFRLLKSLQKTIIISTHEIALAREFAEEIIDIDQLK